MILWCCGGRAWRAGAVSATCPATGLTYNTDCAIAGLGRVQGDVSEGAHGTHDGTKAGGVAGDIAEKGIEMGRALLLELERMEQGGWVVVYTDGSAKRVRGWMQAGYGVWFGPHHNRNFSAHVPAHERQSISRGELRGVLHAMLSRAVGERMVIVLDSEYVFKGITIWTEKWKRHGWRTSMGEVGHRDLWEQIDLLRGMGGEQLQVRWVPSHLNVEGNEAADELAGKGRELHPNNLLPLSKRRRVTEWDAPGLEPMAETSGLEAGPEVDSGGGSSSDTRSSSSSGSGESLSALSCFGSDGEEPYSTNVSDTRLGRPTGTDSDEFSTDVSDSRKRRRREGG